MRIHAKTPSGLVYEIETENEAELRTAITVLNTISYAASAEVPPGGAAMPRSGKAAQYGSKPVGQTISPSGRSQTDMVVDALRALGKPGNAREIAVHLSPDFVSGSKFGPEELVRGLLQNAKRFRRIKRGVYGLPEWAAAPGKAPADLMQLTETK